MPFPQPASPLPPQLLPPKLFPPSNGDQPLPPSYGDQPLPLPKPLPSLPFPKPFLFACLNATLTGVLRPCGMLPLRFATTHFASSMSANSTIAALVGLPLPSNTLLHVTVP